MIEVKGIECTLKDYLNDKTGNIQAISEMCLQCEKVNDEWETKITKPPTTRFIKYEIIGDLKNGR